MADNSVGITVYTAQMFHGVYQYDIAYKLKDNLHLSCIMPAVIGLEPLLVNIADIFDNKKRITVIVNDPSNTKEINDFLFAIHQEELLLFPMTVDQFLTQKPETEAYVLFDLNQNDRRAIGDYLIQKTNRIVISIGQPDLEKDNSFEDKNAKLAYNTFAQLTSTDTLPYPLVFPVHSVLDIRDIMFANLEEKSVLISQLQNVVRHYQYDAKKVNELKEQKEREAAKEKNDQLIEELEMLRKQLAATQRMNEALTLVSESAGVCKEDLQDAANKLVSIKEKYETVCVNEEGNDNEILITQMQNETAEVLAQITNRRLNTYNRDAYENILIDVLGRDVWKRLNSNSKAYLISAKMNFEAMISSEGSKKIDYSGVCLQITKVLDEEMADRIYHRYKSYLDEKISSSDLTKWPRGMTVNRYNQQRIATAEEFTLGSVAFTIGMDKNGQIRNSRDYHTFCQYAAHSLYKSTLSKKDVENHIKEMVLVVEKVRMDFRNPAAHRNTLSRHSAEECMNYMIDQLKKLKKILEDMIV